MKSKFAYHGSEIAIIGMSGRFPSANNVNEFWENLIENTEGITHFSDEELLESGISKDALKDANYIKAKGIVSGCNTFDAEFFDYSDREAVIMDPQLRVYHECAWHALEDSGYALDTASDDLVGIFGGASANPLWTSQYKETAEKGGAEAYEVINLINRDFFNSRISYKLNLKGPAVTIQSACSTSLVAVHKACQSLLSGDSDIALAGAVSLSLNPYLNNPEKQGYIYQEGMILSPDGHCRPFDNAAAGTVLSDGVGFVVLKRLSDAVEDGDRIYAVIKGSGINNDGSEKIGYTAPSGRGQYDVIRSTLNVAEVDPTTVGYIEAHGTGTNIGDPIEVQALLKAYGKTGNDPCYIGSVKSNIGHLDTAAGIAGLIKAVLVIKNSEIPASINFHELNSRCSLDNTRFKIPEKNISWENEYPNRAAISSFGIGGTNAHVIIEEYIDQTPTSDISRSNFLLPITAKSDISLDSFRENLISDFLNVESLTDLSYTLANKRKFFDYRQALLVDDSGNIVHITEKGNIKESVNLYFLFTGQGSQYPQMARCLYEEEKDFADKFDECLKIIESINGPELRDVLIGGIENSDDDLFLRNTENAQLAIFIVEYSLAHLLLSWGVKPKGLIGHSLGEYVAAAIAGVFSLQDILNILLKRGRLMASTAHGSMLAVYYDASMFDSSAWPDINIAAYNSKNCFVVSGPAQAIDSFSKEINANGIHSTELHTSHAFHSSLMDPIIEEFSAFIEKFEINNPVIPIISNLTGKWITPNEIQESNYWARHLREPVLFEQGLHCILNDRNAVCIEVGAGNTLGSLVRQHQLYKVNTKIIKCINGRKKTVKIDCSSRRIAAELFAAGAP